MEHATLVADAAPQSTRLQDPGRDAGSRSNSDAPLPEDAGLAAILSAMADGVQRERTEIAADAATALDDMVRRMRAAGVSRCALAYDGAVGMADIRTGPHEPAAPVPARGPYLAACELLPPAVQDCLGTIHIAAHAVECLRLFAEVEHDPATSAALQHLRQVPHVPPVRRR